MCPQGKADIFKFLTSLVLTLAVCSAGKVSAQLLTAPEPASGIQSKEAVYGKEYMVSSASPYASQAGADVIERGGNALDAAIAAQMVLNVAEPQSSGIGGGGFLLYYDAKTEKITAYDGRETAPQAVTPDIFLDTEGQPRRFFDVVQGGLSVGTPGLLKMLAMAHKEHGRTPWKALFTEAIQRAKEGVPLSPRLHRVVALSPHLKNFSEASSLYYTEDGKVKPVGAVIANPKLAITLHTIAEQGFKPFYEGKISRAIVEEVQNSTINPGMLSLEDLQNYRPVKREALCITYRIYRLCGMPPPSSGGSTVFQALKILEPFNLHTMAPHSVEAIHVIMEASRLAFADRNAYLADSDKVDIPLQAMFDPDYLAGRIARVNLHRAMAKPEAGKLGDYGVKEGYEPPSTTHISIIDKEGNAVSFTSSIEYAFGSGLMVEGFLLNNQLTDFSFVAEKDGKPIANRVESEKRPRSSMSPVFVFDQEGKLIVILGSPGGVRIIPYVLQTLIALLDWDMDMQAAISAPRYVNVSGITELEKGTALEQWVRRLEEKGHTVAVQDLNSGLHGIQIQGKTLIGGADPRREGMAIGH